MAPDNASAQLLTTAQLADRTGVPDGTLRMWQSRYAFPTPSRLAARHRRFHEDDVELVRAVVRLRREGMSLPAAITRANASADLLPESIFAGLARRRPDLQPIVLKKPALLAATRAIEDEYCACAGGGVLIGSFQTAQFYRQSQRRWRELARTARLAVALADFRRLRDPPGGPFEVPVGRDTPLAREWAIVLHGPSYSACLAAWEIPASTPTHDRDRRFEMLWSPEPEAARLAIAIAAELIRRPVPSVARSLDTVLQAPVPPTPPELTNALRLAHRMLGYLANR